MHDEQSIGNIDKYAVVGNPVAHSLSPFIHAEFAKQTKQNILYIRIEAPLDKFQETIFDFRREGGKGANITLPFKIKAFQMADDCSILAQQAGAANTLLFRNDGTIYADSTDGTGLVEDLTHNHHYSLRQKRILLLGAGGAAHTILGPLLEQAPAQLIIANRTKEKAITLAEAFKFKSVITGVGLDEIESTPFDLIINSTSTGLTGEPLHLPNEIINQNSWCYDLMYGTQKTPFLKWAQKFNPEKCLDGLGMLVEQAAASFYLWRGVYPDTAPVLTALRNRKVTTI